jgi:16S rRNA (cytidine1402-2'-O)-methyltransferase
MSKGKLYIIPINIAETELSSVLPDFNASIVKELRFFAVEKVKTARQFLRKMDSGFPIDDSEFYEQDKHDNYAFQREVLSQLLTGNDVGLMSESGYPAVADPGHLIVIEAQHMGIEVVPLVGPSSIIMALSASGLNGQGFSFNGYLPIKEPERSRQLNFTSSLIQKTGFTQIFIETPFRNESFMNDCIRQCAGQMKMCIAYDITGPNQTIITKTLSEWKEDPFKFDKVPCVFILG